MTITTTNRFIIAGLALAALGVISNIILLVLIISSGNYSLVELLSTSEFGFFVIAWTNYNTLAVAGAVWFATGAVMVLTTIIKNW